LQVRQRLRAGAGLLPTLTSTIGRSPCRRA